MLRFSTTITLLSLTILRDSLCRKSSRQLVIFLWTLATLFLALLRLLKPFCFLDNCCCLSFRVLSCLPSIRGLSNLDPSLVTAKWFSPRSIPIALPSVQYFGLSLPSSNSDLIPVPSSSERDSCGCKHVNMRFGAFGTISVLLGIGLMSRSHSIVLVGIATFCKIFSLL
jgi:hypothetical protein